MFKSYMTWPESINDAPFYGNLKHKIIIPKDHTIDIMKSDEELGLYEDLYHKKEIRTWWLEQTEESRRSMIKNYFKGEKSENINTLYGIMPEDLDGIYNEVDRLYNAEEVRNIAGWSFHFYKRNDLSDSELEEEWGRLLNERLKKK